MRPSVRPGSDGSQESGAYGHALEGAQGGQSLHSDQVFVGILGEEFLAGHKRWPLCGEGPKKFVNPNIQTRVEERQKQTVACLPWLLWGVLRGSFWPGDRLLPLHCNGYTTFPSRTVQVFSNTGITKGAS